MTKDEYDVLLKASQTAMRYAGLNNIRGITYEDVALEVYLKLYEVGKSVSDYKYSSLVYLCRHWILDHTLRNGMYMNQDYITPEFDVPIIPNEDNDIDWEDVRIRFEGLPNIVKRGIRQSITTYGKAYSDRMGKLVSVINECS